MKKILQILLGTAMVAAAVLSCKKDELKQETLEVSPSEALRFLAKGNEDAVLTISTNASTYEVDAEKWVITQKDGNKLSVNVEDNKSAERSCDMTISAGTAEPVVIKITQAAGEADAISVAPTSLLFRASGDEPKKLTVTTNVEGWTYVADFGKNEQKDWFTVTPDDADPKSLTVKVRDYTETDGERTGSIDFSAGDAKTSVRVTQTAKDKVEVTPSEPLDFTWNDAERKTIEVMTNAASWDVAVEPGAESWINTQKEGMTLTISVEVNDSESERNGKVTVSAGNAVPVEIKVTQTGKPAPVDGKLADQTSTDDPVRVTMKQGAAAYTVTPVLKLDSALEDAGSMTLYYDEQVLNNWNEFGGRPQCTRLPEDSYTLPEEGFTIPAGQTDVQLPIEINLENLEYETSYMLVLKVQAKSDNIGDVSCGYDGLRYIITTAKGPAKPVDHSTRKNVAILEVNDVNPLSLLEVKFTDGSLFFDGVVLFSSNIQYDADGNSVELYHNPNVQTLLQQRDTYIKPLQDAGIEVYLSILGNHTPARVSNLLPATAEDFAAQVADAINTYHLDGVFLDDEYGSSYGTGAYTDVFYPYTNSISTREKQYSEFGYILKQTLKEECEGNPKVILYQVNDEEWYNYSGTPANEYLDLLIPDHNGTTAQYYGPRNMNLAKENMAFVTWNCRTYGLDENKATGNLYPTSNNMVKKALSDGNWMGWYNLNLDPTSGDGYFNWMNNTVRLMQFYAYYAFDGAEIATPTGYYRKINPGAGDGQFDPNRYEYDGFYSGSDWRDYVPEE